MNCVAYAYYLASPHIKSPGKTSRYLYMGFKVGRSKWDPGHSNEVALNVIVDKCLLQFGQNDASGQFSLKVQKAIEDAPTAIQDFELKFQVIQLLDDLKDWRPRFFRLNV